MRFFKNLIFDKFGIPSLTDTLALVSFVIFIAVSLYLVAINSPQFDYVTFAGLTGGGGSAMKISKMVMTSKKGGEKQDDKTV